MLSPFFAISLLAIFIVVILGLNKPTYTILVLKVCAAVAVLSGIAYAPQEALVPPGAFSEFFGKTDLVRALTTMVMLGFLFWTNLTTIPTRHKVVTSIVAFPLYMALISAATGEPAFTKGLIGLTLRMSDIICFFSFGFWLIFAGKHDEFINFMVLLALMLVGLSIAALIFEPNLSFRANRFRGLSYSANWSGMYFALLTVPVFSAMISMKRLLYRTSMALLFLAILLFLASTGSRGAVLSAMFGLLVFIVVKRTGKISTITMAVLILLALVYLPDQTGGLSIDGVIDRFHTVENTRDTVWQEGWFRWVESGNIWFGTLNAGDAVESQILSILYVYGMIGLVAATISLAYFLKETLYARKGGSNDASDVALSMMAVFFVTCIFETPFFGIISAFNIIFFISVGVLFGDRTLRYQQRWS